MVRFENVKVLKDTKRPGSDGALLVSGPDFPEPVWVPQWAIHDDSDVWKAGQSGAIIVLERFAEKKGWV